MKKIRILIFLGISFFILCMTNTSKVEATENLKEGTYKILMAANPKLSLTVDAGMKKNGANVHIWEDLDTPQQKFKLKYDSDGYYEIIPLNSGKRVNLDGWRRFSKC